MSFGFSIGDAVSLGQLAWKALQNSQKACGEHDELTREVSSLHVVIRRLEKEVSRAESPINRPKDKCKEELYGIVNGCEKVLKLLNKVLEKYNCLSDEERSAKKLWQRVRFGNGELADIRDMREKLIYYTSALSLFVNMVSMGAIGRVEQQMEAAGGDIREIRIAVNGITAHLLSATHREGSVLTTYGDDDKAVWKEFRKELIGEGFSSTIIKKHRRLIKAYIKELGDRGVLDDQDYHDVEESSESANTNFYDNETRASGSSTRSKATAMTPSKTESQCPGDDRPRATENREGSPLYDTYDNGPSSITAPTAKSQNGSKIDGLGNYSNNFKTVSLPAYVPTGMVSLNNKDPYGDCLTVGVYKNTDYPLQPRRRVMLQRFQARLRLLIECLPYFWVFRAREDIDAVHIYVAGTNGIHIDIMDVEYFVGEAVSILVKLGTSTSSPTAFARMLVEYFAVFLVQGYCFQRSCWAEFEVVLSSDWELDVDVTSKYDLIWMGGWIRYFDTGFCPSAQRLSNAWAKAADLIKSSDYDGMKSLALLFTDDFKVSYEPFCADEKVLPAIDSPLSTIWQNNFISTVLPQCRSFFSSPPRDFDTRDSAYKRLREDIESQVVLMKLNGDRPLWWKWAADDKAHDMLWRLKLVNEWSLGPWTQTRFYEIFSAYIDKHTTPKRRWDGMCETIRNG